MCFYRVCVCVCVCVFCKLKDLQAQVDKQADILVKQQRFLETLDRKEREANLVVLGVPDENESLGGATSYTEKLANIWGTIEVNEEIQCHRRLGNRIADSNRQCPILVTMANRRSKEQVLEKANKLKTANGTYKIYIKKDVHPSIRNEWKCLHDAEAAEKEQPENIGCVIRLDTRQRKLYRDETVIDSFNHSFF